VIYRSAFYGTDVFHYSHVIRAMATVSASVSMMGRFEISPETARTISRLPAPAKAKSLLARRSAQRSPVSGSRFGLGAHQFVFPLLGQIGVKAPPSSHRSVIHSYAKRAARFSRDAELFQFIEGLGHVALERKEFRTTICERRHLHHQVLENDPGIVGDFPFLPRVDPIGEFLEFEYDASDFIFVYSEIAKESFLARGFSASKVLVAPLGVPDPLPLVSRERDPYLLAFVGRADAHKGIDVAVAAVEQLGGKYRLEVAGPSTPEVRNWLGTKPRVIYRGILGRNELRNLYSSAAAVIAPSVESFGYAPVEATAHGALLICADTTGAAEFLPESVRAVVVGRDPSIWASHIHRELTSAANSEQERIRASREAINEMSWESASLRVAANYRALTKR
jgi:glycosyltransferase involved in cell wall biosynthesis